MKLLSYLYETNERIHIKTERTLLFSNLDSVMYAVIKSSALASADATSNKVSRRKNTKHNVHNKNTKLTRLPQRRVHCANSLHFQDQRSGVVMFSVALYVCLYVHNTITFESFDADTSF